MVPRCDMCGKFVGLTDLIEETATRVLRTPDSDRSREEYATLCKKCKKETEKYANRKV